MKDYRPEVTQRFLQILEYVTSNKINGITNGGKFLESVGEVQQNRTKFEKGTRYPTINIMIVACKLYDINMNWLMMGEGKMVVNTNAQKRLVEAETTLKTIAGLTKMYQ